MKFDLDTTASSPLADLVREAAVLKDRPFTLLDIGASGGIAPLWRAFGEHFTGLGIDPDAAGCERLNQSEETRPGSFRFVAQTVRQVYYPPESWTDYPGYRLAASQAMGHRPPALTGNLGAPRGHPILDDLSVGADFLKIDTDGGDFRILRGGERTLLGCVGVVIETNFHGSLDENANTFENIGAFLRRRGFSLFDLNGPFRYARQALPFSFLNPFPSQSAKGQVMWADTLWLRDICQAGYFETFPVQFDVQKAVKLAVVASLFDLDDFAAEILVAYRSQLGPLLNVEMALDGLALKHFGKPYAQVQGN